jgi:ABC-type nitrate/sulfonate/bicarbonate transport system ATPase subunit
MTVEQGVRAVDATPGTALSVSDLSFGFPGNDGRDRIVLAGVDFTVAHSEFVTVMGQSGCGKTTLMNIVAGFEGPLSGSIELGGRVVQRPGPDRGMVFQKAALFPWLSVLENVLFGPKAMGWDQEEARTAALSLLEEVGLGGFENYKTYELSGGMQHRVALARTLVMRPPLLLMDEPFAALDAQTRTEMQTLLLDVCAKHRSTVLFVTHDIEEGLLLSDRVIVLGGRPAGIIGVFDIPMERPRAYETVLEPDFIALRARIRHLLHGSRPSTTPREKEHQR